MLDRSDAASDPDGSPAGADRPCLERLVVEASHRGGQVGDIVLPTLLAVADDLDAGALLLVDGEPGDVVLRQRQHLAGQTPRAGLGEVVAAAVDRGRRREEPGSLRHAADNRGRESLWVHPNLLLSRRRAGHQATKSTRAMAMPLSP